MQYERTGGRAYEVRRSTFEHNYGRGETTSAGAMAIIYGAESELVSADERKAAGIGDELVRVAVGLEPPADIIADLARGLDHIKKRAIEVLV